MRTNKDLTLKKGAYCAIPECTVFVPKGTKVESRYDTYFVDPSIFPAHSINRSDATYYGFRVHADDIDFSKERTPNGKSY